MGPPVMEHILMRCNPGLSVPVGLSLRSQNFPVFGSVGLDPAYSRHIVIIDGTSGTNGGSLYRVFSQLSERRSADNANDSSDPKAATNN